jgi:hypothetical protein
MSELPKQAEALFSVAADDFVRERNALAKALRDDGRRDDADAVAALRKPPPVVLAVNRAARDRPEAAKAASRAAARVAETQLGSDPDASRDALTELASSVDLLAEVALAHLSKGGKPPTDAVSRRLHDLLRNAIADESARRELERGVLREETETTGFGAFASVTPGPRKAARQRKPDGARRKREDEKRRERERALRAELRAAERELDDARRAERDAERARKSAERAVESVRARLEGLRADEG